MSMKATWFAGAAIVVACVAVGTAQTAGTSKTPQTASKAAGQAKDAAAAKPMTWTNMKVSDSMCGSNKHTMGKSDAECVAACVKGNSQYVLVDKDNKVYKIDNQKDPDLAKHAGQGNLTVTGTMKGDAVTVTKIVAPPKK